MDHVGILLDLEDVSPDNVAAILTVGIETWDQSNFNGGNIEKHSDHLSWFKSFVTTSSKNISRQLLLRCLNRLSFDSERDRILVVVQSDLEAVRFDANAATITLPEFPSKAKLHEYLYQVLDPLHIHNDDIAQCFACDCAINEIEGIYCANEHFICVRCLKHQVNSVCTKTSAALPALPHFLDCGECHEVYPLPSLMSKLSKALYEKFLNAQQAFLDYENEIKLEARVAARVAEEIALFNSDSSEEQQINRYTGFICQEILTLRCPNPNCRQAWVDYSNCCALHCNRCDTAFCAKCLTICQTDAHNHVSHCVGSTCHVDLTSYWNTQRQEKLKAYLETIDIRIRQKVTEACQGYCRDLGFQI